MSSFAIRGVIEGFYGRPWSWAERDRMVDFLGRLGYNLYVYAPKNDPIHRNRWTEPYLPEELNRFGRLNRRCEQAGIDFVFGISPLKYHYTNQADFDTLWGKILPLYEQGVRSFTMLLDDMPDKFHHPDDGAHFGTLADAHVWLNNTLWEKLQELGGLRRIIFTPTEYCGEGRSSYLEALGRGLRPEIEIFWTGTEVCAQYLKTADARVVSETLKRPVLYWDNYPVNDLEMAWRPHLRPVRGRDPDLADAAKGIVANVSLQPEACKIPLHTYAQYMADPEGYDPDTAWEEALLAVTGNRADAQAVAVLGDMTRWSALERGRQLHNQLAFKMHRFWQGWGGVPPAAGLDLPDAPSAQEGEALPSGGGGAPGRAPMNREALIAWMLAEFTQVKASATRIQTAMGNAYLKAELRPWADKLAGWAEVGIYALTVLHMALANPADPALADMREATLDRLLSNRENFHWVAGDLIDQFSRRVLWAATELADGS